MVLLSFDMEEFDLPMEHGVYLSLDEQMKYSNEGAELILDLLEKYKIKATFFCTAIFALNARELIERIIRFGHEVASHGYNHSKSVKDDLERSRVILEEITGTPVKGYRRPLMKGMDIQAVATAGYTYDSSINPTFIPGRYNNMKVLRTCNMDHGIVEIPASVSPFVRLPLFWLSLHNFPFSFYSWLCRRTLKKDGYLNLYFHPWEFSSHLNDRKLRIPYVIRRNSGSKLMIRLERLIQQFILQGNNFQTFSFFVDNYLYSKGAIG